MAEKQGPFDALGLVGSTIDQIRFDACTGAGGFGLIYRAFHEGLGETVAIKCLRIASIQRTNEAMRQALAARFRDETKLLYRLSQGNLDIVRCIGSGELIAPATREYTPYMVLEWLDGITLSAELRERRRKHARPRSLTEAIALLDSAAGGLAFAHAHDVVHRDVKPGNLFLTQSRAGVRLKVLDFGLAKILSDESIGMRSSVQTGVGVFFCSPSYGAPEQYMGQSSKIGPWTDVYSLCLVLLEIMLGDKVRPASSLADGLIRALDPKTGSPSASDLGLHLSRPVEEILHRALAQDTRERPRDAGEFWAALKEAVGELPDMATTLDDDEGRNVALQPDITASKPHPLGGTVLMDGAPAREAPQPLPAAGRGPSKPGGTSPLAAPLARAKEQVLALETERILRQRPGEHKSTLPIGTLSPLPRTPSGGAPPYHPAISSTPPRQEPSPHHGSSTPPRHDSHGTPPPRADPRPSAPPMNAPPKGLVVFVGLGLLVLLAIAFYLVAVR